MFCLQNKTKLGKIFVVYNMIEPVVNGAMDCGKKKKTFKLVWRCQQLLSGFLTNGRFSRVSRQSRLFSNEKGDNERITGAVLRAPGI